MRTTTNKPNPRGDLISEFGVEPSDLVVCFLGVNDEAGGERDRKVGDPCRDGGRVLTGLVKPTTPALQISGRTVIGAELASLYGITDEGHRQPPSCRELHGVHPQQQFDFTMR